MATVALSLTVALQLVAETALTPYWPGLLRELFGLDEYAATGGYLTACRIAGLAALPLWGLAARRWPLPRLIVAGLLGSAVFDAALALAPGIWSFTAFSAGAVACGGALVLAYPALVSVLERRRHRSGEGVDARAGGGRIGAVILYTAVFHAAAVLATGIGAGIVALPQPRAGLFAFAVVDLALAAVVWRWVSAHEDPVPDNTEDTEDPARPAPRTRLPLVALAAVAALAVLVDVGTGAARPFFVELVQDEGGSLAAGAVLFLLPALAAVAVLPAARPLASRLGGALFPAAGLLAAAGLAVQAAGSGSLPALATGRVVYGLGLGLLAVALDLRIFAAVGTRGPGFSAVETARAGGLLAAPVLATAVATVALPLPLLAAAALFTLAALLAVPIRRFS